MHLSSPEDSEPDPENWNRFSDGANARRLPEIMLKQSEIMIRLIVIQRWGSNKPASLCSGRANDRTAN
jgi:hypothetical protein